MGLNSQRRKLIYHLVFFFLLLISKLHLSNGFYEWSYLQKLTVPVANQTYGLMPCGLFGRGFMTLISGYGVNDPASPTGGAVYLHSTDNGHQVSGSFTWSQQGILIPEGGYRNDGFGKNLLAGNQTLLITAPNTRGDRGYIYVFNGTGRHWSQIQVLRSPNSFVGELFGDSVALNNDRLLVGSKYALSTAGLGYIFERPTGKLYWTFQAKIQALDAAINQYFGEKVTLYGDTLVLSAHNDEFAGDQTGSIYVFSGSKSVWSQQQKLYSRPIQDYQQRVNLRVIDITFGLRFFGRSLAMNSKSIAVGISNLDPGKSNRNSVFIFQNYNTNRWSLQQQLFSLNETLGLVSSGADVYMDSTNTLIASIISPNETDAFVFKTYESSLDWTFQQQLLPFNATQLGPELTSSPFANLSATDFQSPSQWGSHLFFGAGPPGQVQIRSQFRKDSCLLIWMSDHFSDGWDTAVLTVIAPDATNDSFAPHCDQVDPFYVRYCPYQATDEGVYILKVFAAIDARFFWELSWQVYLESTGEWFKGDFSTKMEFNFNASSMTFSYYSSDNLIDLNAPCYRCTRIDSRNWKELQISGNSAFWPLTVTGAPYFISDYQARTLYAVGKVCEGVETFQCYQTLIDGIYILRLGGGPFGKLTGFPHPNASWYGCGESGTLRDQFVFAIKNGHCVPIQKFDYTSRCSHPPAINQGLYEQTPFPTFGGTVSPTESTFGKPYVKGQMYSVGKGGLLKNQPLSSSIFTQSELTSSVPQGPSIPSAKSASSMSKEQLDKREEDILDSILDRSNHNGFLHDHIFVP